MAEPRPGADLLVRQERSERARDKVPETPAARPQAERRDDARSRPVPVRRSLIGLLSSRTGLRQAMLLQEVLGRPLSLRDPGDRPRID